MERPGEMQAATLTAHMTAPNERELVHEAQAFSKEAWARIYDEYYPKMYDYCYLRTGNRAVADDLTRRTTRGPGQPRGETGRRDYGHSRPADRGAGGRSELDRAERPGDGDPGDDGEEFSVTDLAVGDPIRVRGTHVGSALVQAERIELDDEPEEPEEEDD